MKPKSIKFAAMTIHEAGMRLLFQLYELYDDREAANIADLIMEDITGWKRIDRIINKEVKLSRQIEMQLEKYTEELLSYKPVQYVLHEAWFAGMKLYVDENVLIPRPETEELADHAIKEILRRSDRPNTILDIGTGSGCLAIAIKKKLPVSQVYAIDISAKALEIAKRNADENQTELKFFQADILDEKKWTDLPSFDFIVSNPPYIPSDEINMMHENVTRFEPHLALFVPGNDPLIFYQAISRFAEKKLLPGGKIFIEVHESYADGVRKVFGAFDSAVIRDMQGKERFVITAPLPYQP